MSEIKVMMNNIKEIIIEDKVKRKDKEEDNNNNNVEVLMKEIEIQMSKVTEEEVVVDIKEEVKFDINRSDYNFVIKQLKIKNHNIHKIIFK